MSGVVRADSMGSTNIVEGFNLLHFARCFSCVAKGVLII